VIFGLFILLLLFLLLIGVPLENPKVAAVIVAIIVILLFSCYCVNFQETASNEVPLHLGHLPAASNGTGRVIWLCVSAVFAFPSHRTRFFGILKLFEAYSACSRIASRIALSGFSDVLAIASVQVAGDAYVAVLCGLVGWCRTSASLTVFASMHFNSNGIEQLMLPTQTTYNVIFMDGHAARSRRNITVGHGAC